MDKAIPRDNLIFKYINEEQYSEAYVLAKKQLAQDQNNSDVMKIMADIEIGLGDYKLAFEHINKCMEENPDDAEAKAIIVRLSRYIKCDDVYKANFEEIEGVKSPDGYLGQESFYIQQGCIRKAVEIMNEAYRLFPDDNRILREYIAVLSMNNIDDPMLDGLFDAVKTYQNVNLLSDWLLLLYKRGEYEKCTSVAKHIIYFFPNSDSAQVASKIIKRINDATRSPLGNNYENNSDCIGEDEESSDLHTLDSLIGLEPIKKEIHRILKKIEFDNARKTILKVDYENTDAYHFVFTGNPGTGKTTVARLLGGILCDAGLLEGGQMIEVERGDLIGEYQGHTAIRTQSAIDRAIGGILFIDEAYSLLTGENDNFGREAIDTLVKGMEDNRERLVVILAGYTNEMRKLIDSNVGLESRFTKFIEFPDYTEDELLEIAKAMAAKQHYRFSEEGEIAFRERIRKKQVNRKFGNARAVRTIMSEAYMEKAMNYNCSDYDRAFLTILSPEDFGITLSTSSSERAEDAIKKLEALIGMRNVKHEIMSRIRIVDYLRHETETGRNNQMNMINNLNLCFTGNPGTGKTTVARIYADVLAAIGAIKNNTIIEASRVDFVGRYQGETAIKTSDICERSYGGVLFIDEAYSLIQEKTDSFGREAVATLIKQMEDNRDKMVVIFAGNTAEMQGFFDANPGIRSRIAKVIEFEDYDVDSLYQIFCGFADSNNIIIPTSVRKMIYGIIQSKYNDKDANFGNARFIRNLFGEIWKNMVNRVELNNLSGEERRTFNNEDIIDIAN